MFKNWSLVRILRIVIGLGLLGSYFFYAQEIFALIVGSIFLTQGVLNLGCPAFFGQASCTTPSGSSKTDLQKIDEEVIFERIN
jgi:HKD family nuclease